MLDGKTLGLALSGGGYRATLFGLGSLWRLSDAGLLGRIDRITSVSGGSILAGLLALRWSRLAFVGGQATNFADEIAAPIRALCSTTIDVEAAVKGALVPGWSAGDFLEACYAEHLYGEATMKEIAPAHAPGTPLFTLQATNLQTGRSFRFRQDMLADWMLGVCRSAAVPLARAVAASSAFPPVFSPVIVQTDPADWTDGGTELDGEAYKRRIVLADGGVYDNLGLESIADQVDIALVSDAGAPFEPDPSPSENLGQLFRVNDILIDQTRALRKRWLIEGFQEGRRRGAYWGIGTHIGDYESGTPMIGDNELTTSLESVPTRLGAFDAECQGHLINWGYALCDAALRTRARLPVDARGQWPVPEHALDAPRRRTPGPVNPTIDPGAP